MHDEKLGLHSLCHKTIQTCDMDIRRALCENLILSGGTTMLQGLPARLETELQALVPTQAPHRAALWLEMILDGCQVKMIAPPERMISVWIGGSVLSGTAACAISGLEMCDLLYNYRLELVRSNVDQAL